MSATSDSFYVVGLTDRIGIGATINAQGHVGVVLGPEWMRTTVDPNGVLTAKAGSLASQTDGTLWINVDNATTWQALGGTSGGWKLADNQAGIAGSTSPAQVTYTFVTASNRLEIASPAVSSALAVASSGALIKSGNVTVTGAVAGLSSGPLGLLTGNTIANNAGATAGDTGGIDIRTGGSSSTLGTSGKSGGIAVATGPSEDNSSGDINLSTGAAPTSGSINLTIGAGTGGAVNAVGRLTTTDGVAAGTVRVVGGRAFATTSDSAAVVGNGALQPFNQTYPIPADTLKSASTIEIFAMVRRTGINAADTAQVVIQCGGTTYVTSLAAIALVGERCIATAKLTARAAPAGAVAVVGGGSAGWSTAGSATVSSGATANLATNGPLTVSVGITMPNNPGNTAVLECLTVDVT